MLFIGFLEKLIRFIKELEQAEQKKVLFYLITPPLTFLRNKKIR